MSRRRLWRWLLPGVALVLLVPAVVWLLSRRRAAPPAGPAPVVRAPSVPVVPGPSPASEIPPAVPPAAAKPKSRWPWLLIVYAVLIVLIAIAVGAWMGARRTAAPPTVRVAAVGDMACDPTDPYLAAGNAGRGDRCRHRGVSDLAVAMKPDLFIGLGDFQYEMPAAAAYRGVYGPSFGRLFDRTVPVFGNQEYKVHDAHNFTEYFGDRIRDPKGYWSQEIGGWHLVVLNSNCGAVVGGCGPGSPQQTWLDKDLTATKSRCVLAAWHHPRWSSGIAGGNVRTTALFQTLYDHRVELVLSGHDADYERFGPLDPGGKPDPKGVRQYVVGTGGQAHYRLDERARKAVVPGLAKGEFIDYDHHGVLELNLEPAGWQWRFHALGAPIEDEGKAACS